MTRWPLLLALLAACSASEQQPNVLREFKNSALIELSSDGQWILTASRKRVNCVDGKAGCNNETLTVYEASSGNPVGELVSKPEGLFLGPGFVEQGMIETVELACYAQQNRCVQVWLIWDPITKSEKRYPAELPKDFNYLCPVNDQLLLGAGKGEISPPWVAFERNGELYVDDNDPANRVPRHMKVLLTTLAPGSSTQPIGVLTDAPLRYAFACKAWRSGQSFLLEDADSGKLGDPSGFGKSLTWFSIEAGTPSRLCHAFEDQDINGYAISPDTSRIAVITSVKADPDYPAFLTVLDGSSCAELSRFKLEFPEKPRSRAPLLAPSKKYFDNVPFPAQFARQIAISPDNTKLALAYGISKGISGLAFFGVYSMGDGHRMATFKGDTYTPSLLATFIGDELSAGQAPLDGAMQFSIDSKSLYTSSLRVRQWDVSKLR